MEEELAAPRPPALGAAVVGTEAEDPSRSDSADVSGPNDCTNESNDSSMKGAAKEDGPVPPTVPEEVCAGGAQVGGGGSGRAAGDEPAGSGDENDAMVDPLAVPAAGAKKTLRRSWSAPADTFSASPSPTNGDAVRKGGGRFSAAAVRQLMSAKRRRNRPGSGRLPSFRSRIAVRSTSSHSTKERHDLYAAQLAATPLVPDVVRSIRRLHEVKKRFALRRVAEDLMFALMLIGLALMIATNEVTQANRTALYDAGECEWGACDPRDCWYTFTLKALTTLSTAVLIGVLTWRYSLVSALLVLRGYAAKKKLDCLCRRPTLRIYFIVEIIVCALHIPPGVDFSFGSVSTARGNETAASRVVHVNTLGVIMFVRLYQLIRIARNHNGVFNFISPPVTFRANPSHHLTCSPHPSQIELPNSPLSLQVCIPLAPTGSEASTA